MKSSVFNLIVGIAFISLLLNPATLPTEAKEPPIDNLFQPIFHTLENATFVMELNTTALTRGEDDLLILFQYTYEENESYIPDSYIFFNITNPSVEIIYENTILLNDTETGYFNQTIPWPTLQL